MASSESSLLVLEDVVVSLESSLWDSSPKELVDSMNLPISSISTSRDVSSIQPKTRRLDEAYHRLQLLHLSQNLEDKRLLQKKTQKMREKTRKVCRINKNWPFDVVFDQLFLRTYAECRTPTELQNLETRRLFCLSNWEPPVGWCRDARESHP